MHRQRSCGRNIRYEIKRWRNDKFEWDIPVYDKGDIVLYAHTFVSSLQPTKLANEDPLLQAQTKIDVLETPKEHVTPEHKTDDLYPWLDIDDPR